MPARGSRLGRAMRRAAISIIVLATIAYYFWTAMLAPGGMPRIHGEESDHFNLLSRGFKKGHLYLDSEVPGALLNARNPYDPASRGDVQVLHDASFYRGKYYIYFGPAPVVTLLLPFSIVTGRDLPLPYAVWFFSSLGYLALVGVFLFLQQRHYPRAGMISVLAGLLALGGANMLVALLRRSHIWELPASCGLCFFALSLWCLVRALHSPRAARWAIAGGLALGLAVAARPTYLVCSMMFAAPLLLRGRAVSRNAGYNWRALAGAAAGCGLVLVALLLYNYARFANPLEFGQKYQLSSIIEGDARHFSVRYIPFNFHLYFLSALRWHAQFPFHDGVAVPPIPPEHAGYEFTIGILPNLPFAWFSGMSLALLFGRALRRTPSTEILLAIGAITTAVTVNAALLLCYFGCCIRYLADFTPGIMLLAAFGLLECEARASSPLARRSIGAVGLLLALFSTFAAAMSVVRFYEPNGLPRAYQPVARALNRPWYWLQQKRFPDYSPVEIALTFPADRSPRQEVLATVNRDGPETAAVLIDYLDAEKIRLGYREKTDGPPVAFSPAVAAGNGRHALRISLGGPYSDFNGFKSRLRAQFDALAFWDVPAVSFGAYPGKLRIGSEVAASSPPSRFSGIIHSTRSIILPDLPRPQIVGIRVRVTLDPSMAGRAFPLVTTGRTKAGDLFFLRVLPDGKIGFGYDHWGEPLAVSPDLPAKIGETHVVEFWIPALTPDGRPPALLVKLDGAWVWRQPAAAFPITPQTIFLGSNPIGGSTCEPSLEHSVFEELQLPFPGAEK